MISIKNLAKYYNNKAAIQDITLHIASGERVGIFGPHGAGKTLLLRLLTTYAPPTKGSITVAGFDALTDSLEVRKRVGYLPQNVPLYTTMTVYGYLDFVASLRKVPHKDKRIQDVLDLVYLTDQTHSKIDRLPVEAQRRVGLAQAIVHQPDVLILDEPTLNLSPQHIINLQELIKSVAADYTLLLGTCTLSEAERICNRVFMMNKGRIIANDHPSHLESRLEGGQRIRLQVSSAPGDAACILQSLAGVKRVTSVQTGVFDIEYTWESRCQPVTDLVEQQEWGLLALQVLDDSLEDVFMELVADTIVAVA